MERFVIKGVPKALSKIDLTKALQTALKWQTRPEYMYTRQPVKNDHVVAAEGPPRSWQIRIFHADSHEAAVINIVREAEAKPKKVTTGRDGDPFK